jgi:DNA-binding transcriptional ArsR family regulator
MADIFDVISDPTRRDVLEALLAQYVSADSTTGELSVGELVERLELTQPTVSKHLKVLRDHGLVSVREEGQHRYYRLDATPLEVVEDWLIPYLSADFDDDGAGFAGEGFADADGGSAVFAAWSGVDVGQEIGRRVAEGVHQAGQVVGEVGKRIPRPLRRRPFRR